MTDPSPRQLGAVVAVDGDDWRVTGIDRARGVLVLIPEADYQAQDYGTTRRIEVSFAEVT